MSVVLPPMCAAAYATGSITLTCNVNRDGVDAPLAGDAYEFSLVAAAQVVNGELTYETTGPFASIDCEWGGLDAGQLRSRAREAAELAARNGIAADATGFTDAQGKISAQGLRLGMYLVRRVAVAPANDRTLVDPMLISVPARVGDSLEYQVVANPKVEIEGAAPEPADPSAPDSNGIIPWFDLPTTGDVQMLLVGLVALLGGSMIAVSRRVTR
ncbi:hypothetical protein [Collinsella intestinalis]|uniref:hypothetical protein n=1 Tax=Collinsella intestinalis TaxID=147207 RepID=UPI0022E5FAC0|nr:hypothetical protein [Collinsella intestinalis]